MKLISAIQLNNFLSFSEDTQEFELADLNVFIGANGSGKSNFLDAIAILRSLALGNSRMVFSQGGGIQQWIFNRKPESKVTLRTILRDKFVNSMEHVFEFEIQGVSLNVVDEKINSEKNILNEIAPYLYYRFNQGKPFVSINNSKLRELSQEHIDISASILSQRKDPENYPEISKISDLYSKIRMYRNWEFGKNSNLRQSQVSDLISSYLEEDFSNFFLFLNRLFRIPKFKKQLIELMKDVMENISDIIIDNDGQRLQLLISEADIPYSSARLSDGTLRYLVLLSILLDPEPPPLICIEEPEIGMHPDLISSIAKLLKDASSRTQLIVTTHSERLVNAFADSPESIVVCEKEAGATMLKRLQRQELDEWLEHYSLGELWLRGQVGGVRW